MATSKKPRKPYRPKPVNPGAFATAIIGTYPLAEDQQRDLSLAYRCAFQALRMGAGTEETANTVACALNIAMVLAERGSYCLHMEEIKAAQAGLMRCKERAARLGRWALDGEGFLH